MDQADLTGAIGALVVRNGRIWQVTAELAGQDFLKEADFTRSQLEALLHQAAFLKRVRRTAEDVPHLAGQNLALVFEKSSTRTRCAFEVAAFEQGARVTYLDPDSSQIGHKESAADTAEVLSRMYDGIAYRGSRQAIVEELAASSRVPVFNALTDEWHPTQMLADFLTMREHAPGPEIAFTYIGDARNNMGNSFLVTGAIMGVDTRICAPRELWPDAEVQSLAQARAAESGARLLITEDPKEAVRGVDFIATDVWVSMGEPKEVWDERIELLRPYQVNAGLLELSGNPDVKFLHCLPAFHDMNTVVGRTIAERTGMLDGLEVTDEVFRSPASLVFDEAENRLHTIKAVLVATMATPTEQR
jgi:ornithine carbamoyltransferase